MAQDGNDPAGRLGSPAAQALARALELGDFKQAAFLEPFARNGVPPLEPSCVSCWAPSVYVLCTDCQAELDRRIRATFRQAGKSSWCFEATVEAIVLSRGHL